MATPTEQEFLNQINSQFDQKFTSVNEYLNAKGVKGMASKAKRKERWDNFQVSKTGKPTVAIDSREKAARQAFVDSPEWLDFLEDGYGWLVNVYKSVPEVAKIIRDGYVNGTPPQEIVTKVTTQSDWAKSLQAGEYNYLKGATTQDRAFLDSVSARERQVRDLAQSKGYGLNESQVKFLASSSMKGNWDQLTLDQEIGKAIVAKPKEPGMPLAVSQGPDAPAIRAKAQAFGLKLSDSQVNTYAENVLTGSMSDEQLTTMFRNQAKNLYPSVATQLDSGTLNDAVNSYRNIAAQVLQIDESAVDFTDPAKFGKLLTYQDPKSGEARLMNATEWTGYLRRLPEWQNTSTAKQTYGDLMKTVETIFGKAR